MLKPGTRAIVRIGNRTISVKGDPANGRAFNTIDYGISALSNDFRDEILFKAALEDATTKMEVLNACHKYYRYPNGQAMLVAA